MRRAMLVLLVFLTSWGNPKQVAFAQNSSPDPSTLQIPRNPILVEASRINPSEIERIADQLRKIVQGPPLPRTRPAIDPVTQDEWNEIRNNPLLEAASSHDRNDTILWLRKINKIISSEH